MRTVIRALVALSLTVALSAAPSAEGAPEGDTTAANFDIDVVVRGNAPAGETITVRVQNGGDKELVIDLDEVDDADDGQIVSGTITRWLIVTDDAGADGLRFACTMVHQEPPPPGQAATCDAVNTAAGHDHQAGPHVDANFVQNGTNRTAQVTITLTFGACDGRPATVFLADGESPTSGRDVILGTPAAETITAHGGDDVVCGGGGNDVIRSGEGRDRVLGGGGGDRLEGGAEGDTLLGGPGPDTLLGLAGNDALDGGGQRDTCNGGTQRDTGIRCEVRNGIP